MSNAPLGFWSNNSVTSLKFVLSTVTAESGIRTVWCMTFGTGDPVVPPGG